MSYTVNVDDGESTYLWDVAIEVTNIDPATGIGTMTFTPRGGRARLPGVIDGRPGLPPTFRFTTLHEVAPGDELPLPNLVFTPVSPGGPGVASVYDVDLWVHKGNTGADGSPAILGSSDLVGTPAADYMPVYVTDTGLAVGASATGQAGVVWAPQRIGGIYTATTISSTSGNASPRTLASVAIPAQLRPWRPKVSGFVVPGNAPDTQVDLVATVGNGTSDDQVGYGRGVLGSTVYPVNIGWSGWGAALGSTGGKYSAGYGVVPKGQATTVFLIAKQIASTTSNWTTPAAGPTAAFSVEVSPIP